MKYILFLIALFCIPIALAGSIALEPAQVNRLIIEEDPNYPVIVKELGNNMINVKFLNFDKYINKEIPIKQLSKEKNKFYKFKPSKKGDHLELNFQLKRGDVIKYGFNSTYIYYNSTTFDGYVCYSPYTWDTVHNSDVGNNADYAANSFIVSTEYHDATPTYKICRAFIAFNTSLLPEDITYSSGNLQITIAGVTYEDKGQLGYLTVVNPINWTNSTTVITNDYSRCGANDRPTTISKYLGMGNFTTGQTYNFSLDDSQLNRINTTGLTFFGIRTGHDYNDTPIRANKDNKITIWSANSDFKPILHLTYLEGKSGGSTTTTTASFSGSGGGGAGLATILQNYNPEIYPLLVLAMQNWLKGGNIWDDTFSLFEMIYKYLMKAPAGLGGDYNE
jgi:hypothetical protein